MHSNIYVLKEIENGDYNPSSYKYRHHIDEDELANSFCPHYGDYVILYNEDEIKNEIKWLCNYVECFTLSYENNIPYLTFDVENGLKFLKRQYDIFNELKDKMTFEKFINPYDGTRYDLKESMNDTHGFWIITIDKNNGWYYQTLHDWLCDQCISKLPTLTFRVEDVFDYHF